MFDILLEHHRKLDINSSIAPCLGRIVFWSVGHAADIHPWVLRPDPLREEVAVPGSALRPGRAPRQHDGGRVQQLEVLRQALDHRLGGHRQEILELKTKVCEYITILHI